MVSLVVLMMAEVTRGVAVPVVTMMVVGAYDYGAQTANPLFEAKSAAG